MTGSPPWGFLGPNGSGKTTTLRMICGLLTPDSGAAPASATTSCTERDEIKRHVGYMTQRFSLYQDLSIQENLEFVGARLRPRRSGRSGAAGDRAAGPRGRETQLAGTLSGGWKQRLALGACILPKPELLLLDEPTAGVDPKARREFWGEIHKLAAEGMTVLVSTHYMDEAERCHEIAYIAYGELLAQGTIEEVIAHSHLRTYTVSGPDLQSLAEKLVGMPGIDMVAPFGTSLHVAGRDAAALDAAVAQVRDRPELRLDAVAALARGRVHRPDVAARRTTSDDRLSQSCAGRRAFAHGGHVHQGVRAAAARPADLRHHDLHPASCSSCCSATPSTPRRAICRPPCWCTRRAISARSMLAALSNTSYFAVTRVARSEAEMDHWMRSGDVLFGVEIPAGFERGVRRGDRPALLVAADASDPVAAGTALGALEGIVSTALARDRGLPETIQSVPAFEIRQHRRYNPAAVTSLNIVPGLLGTILTMTMLIFTALSVTREIERGTMESLLAMPIEPLEIMLGKIAPYIVIGFLQAALILAFGTLAVRGAGRRQHLAAGGCSARCSSPPICRSATPSRPSPRTSCRRSRCPSCSSCPTSCCRASCSRSRACRGWAQVVGELLPLTHYIRIVRGIMLKGADPLRSARRGAGAAGPDAARHDARRAPLPHDAGLKAGPCCSSTGFFYCAETAAPWLAKRMRESAMWVLAQIEFGRGRREVLAVPCVAISQISAGPLERRWWKHARHRDLPGAGSEADLSNATVLGRIDGPSRRWPPASVCKPNWPPWR